MGKTNRRAKRVENPLEAILDQIRGKAPQISESATEKRSGVLEAGKAVSLARPQKQEEREREEKALKVEAAIDYSREVIQVVETAAKRENMELEAQLKEIMAEIKKLADSSKELQVQFKSVAVEQYVNSPGEYHKSFFAWLLSLIRAARMKVEDSGAWLAAMHSKKKSREYTAMAKKQGTSFTLNNERAVATQVG